MTEGGTAADGTAADSAGAHGATGSEANASATTDSATAGSATTDGALVGPTDGTVAGGALAGGALAGGALTGGALTDGALTDGAATDGAAASGDSPTVIVERRRRMAVIAVIAAAVLVVDQVTKSLAVEHLSDQQIHLLGPFYLALSYNTGVAFSIGTGLTLPITLIAVAVVASIVWFSRGVPSTLAAVAVGLVLGGAVGNLSDRLFRGHHGGVVDFFYSGFWPTFNVADACIVVGSLLVALTLWRRSAP